MQRKPGFPVANCSIKMPDSLPASESMPLDDDGETVQRRQQLINFGHKQWGFNHWSWSVTKQDLDFVDFASGKFCAGVCAYVSVTVKSLDIHRENIGYGTSLAPNKGAAIHKSRKCAVTNALSETLLSFGGSVATELMELLETHKTEHPAPAVPEPAPENNHNIPNKPAEAKNSPLNKPPIRKEEERRDSISVNVVRSLTGPPIKNAIPNPPPVAKAHPIPVNLPPANRPVLPANAPRPPPPRPNSNDRPLESMSEEEARAERKRRQQRAQEEFRLKMLQNQGQGNDEKPDMSKAASSFDALLMDIPTQDIDVEQTGDDGGKRKSPAPDGSAKRRAGANKLDIVID